ncbi:MAG: hypothetical protein JKY95_19560, partial [Planctomycetaceae bacterium]|nr:hypothetical protein [Planctomycetaceae bacterium]
MIQREEFKHQKEEFIKNTKALNDQHEEMDLANKVNMFSAIQNAASFFTEMNNYEPTVTSQKLNSIVFLKRHLKLKHIEMVVTDNLSTLGENLHEKKAGVFHQFRISNSQNFELVNAGEIFVNMHSFIRENRMMVCGSQDSGNNNVLTKSKHELAISSLEKMHESIEHIMNYLIYENGTQELVRPVNDLNTILSRVIQDDISISEWRSIYDRITKLTEQVMRVIADSLQQ